MPTRGRPTQESSALRWFGRLISVLEREGAPALARRKLSQFAGLLALRVRVFFWRRRSWRKDERGVFLLINHRCGGGTERHLGDLEAALRTEGVRPLVVRPGQRGRLLWEERGERLKTLWCRESSTDRDSVARMLSALSPVHAHVQHSMGLPEVLFDLLEVHGITYDWTVHDYHSICPRVNLIGSSGRYCGEPDMAACDNCLARIGDDQGRAVSDSIAVWRKRSANRLAGARRVFVPSADVARRLERYFPGRKVTLRPHAECLPSLKSLAAPLRASESVRVAVIGTLVRVKGSERLLACARDARIRRLGLEFHVIGTTDCDALLARQGNVHVTGRYRETEVYDRLLSRRCHLAFLPSECPESYMYTLSIAMAARMFVVCFDLGAQALRVRAWGWGRPIELDRSPGEINDALIAAAQYLMAGPSPPDAPAMANYPDILTSYYDFTAGERGRIAGSSSRLDRLTGSNPHKVGRRDHARLH